VWLDLMLPVLNIHGLSAFCIHFIETLLRSSLCANVLFTAAFVLTSNNHHHYEFYFKQNVLEYYASNIY